MADTRYGLVFSRSRIAALSTPINAWEGADYSHVGVCIAGAEVIDATLWHGVAKWSLEKWVGQNHLIDTVPIYPRTPEQGAQAEKNLRDKVGEMYDLAEMFGFALLRDIGSARRPICSTLARDFVQDATGLVIPGRRGRWGPRLMYVAAQSYLQGMQAAGFAVA